ncbi:hypothetical protein EV360DRAFT_81197 [Lentinula raphanica]|nr:hypothetical protein EV360DRAFT_81197 [Lentinula raphanica]
MTRLPSFLTTLLLLPLAFTNVASIPAIIAARGTDTNSEISSVETNFTSEALYAVSPRFQTREPNSDPRLSKRLENQCETFSTADVQDVEDAFKYLYNEIGNTECSISEEDVTQGKLKKKVKFGTALVELGLEGGVEYTQSLCKDVGLTVQWIFTNCNVNGQVGGSGAANGNGDLLVAVTNVDLDDELAQSL